VAFSDHLRLTCLVDGVKQIKVTQVRVSPKGQNQKVETLEGLVGKTPGSKFVEVSANWALPISGLEFDVVGAIADGSYHEVQVPLGSKSFVAKGWFEEGEIGQSTNANTEVSATFIGELVPLQ
jgi:hypothetical protein